MREFSKKKKGGQSCFAVSGVVFRKKRKTRGMQTACTRIAAVLLLLLLLLLMTTKNGSV
jgi:hypothetical protein